MEPKRALKIVLYSILLSLLVFIGVYMYFKATMFEDIRVTLQKELSAALDQPVEVQSMDFLPFNTFSLRNINIYDKSEKPKLVMTADTVNISVDLWAAIIHKELKTTIDLYDLYLDKDVIVNALFRTYSAPAKSHKKIFSMKLIQKLSLLASDINIRETHVRNITGEIALDELKTTDGEIKFGYRDRAYTLAYSRIAGGDTAYRVHILSRDMDISGDFYLAGEDLEYRKFTGRAGSLYFSVDGKVSNFMMAEKWGYASGSLEANIKDLANMPLDKTLSETVRNNGIDGYISIKDLDLEFSDTDPDANRLAGNVKIRDLSAWGKKMDDLSAAVSLSKKRMSFSEVSAALYGGTISGRLIVNVDDKGSPYLYLVEAAAKKFDIELLQKLFGVKNPGPKGVINMTVAMQRKPEDSSYSFEHSFSPNIFLELSKYKGKAHFNFTELAVAPLRKIDELSVDVTMVEDTIVLSGLTAFLYNGSITGGVSIKLSEGYKPYVTEMASEISSLDLDSIIRDLKWNNDVFTGGILSANISMKRNPSEDPTDLTDKVFAENLYKELTKFSGAIKFSVQDPVFKGVKNIDSLSATLNLYQKREISLTGINASLTGGEINGDLVIGFTGAYVPFYKAINVSIKNMDMPVLLETFKMNKNEASGRIVSMSLALARHKYGMDDAADLEISKNLFEELSKFKGQASLSIMDPGFRTLKLKHIDSLSADLSVAGPKMRFSNIKSALYGGTLGGMIEFWLDDNFTPYIYSIDGNAGGIDLAALLADVGAKKHKIFGALSMNLSLQRTSKRSAPDDPRGSCPQFLTELSHYNGHGFLSLAAAGAGNIKINKISSKFSLENSVFLSKEIEASLYDGKMAAKYVMSLKNPSLRYELSYKASGIDYSKLVTDINQEGSNVYGTLGSTLSVTGSALDLGTMTGDGTITIQDANLGPMPLISPLVGNIYSVWQTMFAPGAEATITSASAKVRVDDKKVIADDVAMWGEEIYMDIEGYIGFNGSVDLYFQNGLVEDEEAEEQKTFQTAFRDFAVNFGRSFCKAHMSGTINDPEWTFENPRD